MSDFPQVIAAIDCWNIGMKALSKNLEDYINRKEYHAIVLQGLVDNRYLFKDVSVGWTEKSHDARIFRTHRIQRVSEKELSSYKHSKTNRYCRNESLNTW